MLGFMKRGAQRLGSGASGYLRGGQSGALVTQDAHGRFQEAVLGGNVWIGANPAGTPVTTQAALSVTTPALTLFNPINSPVNLVLLRFECSFAAAPAAASQVVLAVNQANLASVPTGPTVTTAANVFNANLLAFASAATPTGGPWGQCYRVATLSATPLAVSFPFGTTGAAAISGMSYVAYYDGSIVIPPGIALSLQTVGIASVVGAFCWEELPIVP